MAKSDESTRHRPQLDKIAKFAPIVSAIVGTCSFILALLGFGGISEAGIVALQGFATILLLTALCLYLLNWEKTRDKWPGRLNELTRKLAPVAVSDAKILPPEFARYVLLVYREYHRMALVEGRKELAEDFEKEIKKWEKILKKSEALYERIA